MIHGLHRAVYTADPENGYQVARRTRSGSVTVNGMIVTRRCHSADSSGQGEWQRGTGPLLRRRRRSTSRRRGVV